VPDTSFRARTVAMGRIHRNDEAFEVSITSSWPRHALDARVDPGKVSNTSDPLRPLARCLSLSRGVSREVSDTS
jgi:hypothetical protein